MIALPSAGVICALICATLAVNAIKIAVLLTAAWGITRKPRGFSAAMRHLIWAIAMTGALVLPVLQLVAPRWNTPPVEPVSQLWRAAFAGPFLEYGSGAASVNAVIANPHVIGWTTAIAAMWLTGAGLMLLRLVVGLALLRRASKTSQPLIGECFSAALERCAKQAGLRRPVRLLIAQESRVVPCTWGVVRPNILLPSSALTWPACRLHVVLAHELAHVRRLDWPFSLIAQGVRAVFWFHPLVWLAASRLREESERACDDAVLATGESATAYAAELLDLVRQAHNFPAAALAVARHSNIRSSTFERRFASMLDPNVNRRRLTRQATLLATAAALLCLVPLASLRVPAAEIPGQFSGSVVDSTGAAMANATVIMTDTKTHEVRMTGTDATGTYHFDGLPAGDYEKRIMRDGFAEYRSPQSVDSTANSAAPVTVISKGELAPVKSETRKVRIGGGVAASNLIHQVLPIYPAEAKAAGIQGTVTLGVVIGLEGRPISMRVLNTEIEPALARSAIEAVSQWRYKPTLLNGNPIEVATEVNVNFTLAQ